MKRLITSMLIVLLISVAFIGSFYKGYYSYAEDINYMSDAELEAAYQAYLQSKGGSIIGNAGARLAYTNGKMLNFLTSEYNTTPYKNINQVKGLLAWEKRELESGNTSVLQLTMRHPEVFSLYTQWLLQNHYFGNDVSETDGIFNDDVDNTVYSGELVTDGDGNTALAFILPTTDTLKSSGTPIAKGSLYKYSNADLISMFPYPELGNTTYNYIPYTDDNGSKSVEVRIAYTSNWKYMSTNKSSYTNSGSLIQMITSRNNYNGGYFIVSKVDNSYYVGIYSDRSLLNAGSSSETISNAPSWRTVNGFIPVTKQNSDINFYTNITNIGITNYPDIDADGTLYITPKVKVGLDYQPYTVNEGDTIQNVVNNYYNDSGEKDKTTTVPSTTPDSGSGGSGGGNNPSGGTPPNWSNPYPNLSPDGNGGFNFNFNLPDLNIDWNISGLSEKFPFSIPFDLIRFITVLNAEPETPHFEGTVNLIVYQWDIDADLSQFDNLASIVRNVEFIGFCITLILITRRMIKG